MLRITYLFLLFISTTYASYHVDKAIAKIDGEAKGVITFTQDAANKETLIYGEIQGLKAGRHGFHIHVFGDLSNGCSSAGSHFNPYNKTHGNITAMDRHIGDLGNIIASANGVAIVHIKDHLISLNGENSVVGRALVVHADEDDLGLGGQSDSLTTGHAGARAGCGVIGIASVTQSTAVPTISVGGFLAITTAVLGLLLQ